MTYPASLFLLGAHPATGRCNLLNVGLNHINLAEGDDEAAERVDDKGQSGVTRRAVRRTKAHLHAQLFNLVIEPLARLQLFFLLWREFCRSVKA